MTRSGWQDRVKHQPEIATLPAIRQCVLPARGFLFQEYEVAAVPCLRERIGAHRRAAEAGQTSYRSAKDTKDFPVTCPMSLDGGATWRLTELAPTTQTSPLDCAISVATIRRRLGLPVERDVHFRPTSLYRYTEEAARTGRIVT